MAWVSTADKKNVGPNCQKNAPKHAEKMNMSLVEDGTTQGSTERCTKAGDLEKTNVSLAMQIFGKPFTCISVSLASPMSHPKPSAPLMCSWGWSGVEWGVMGWSGVE